jgi:hypothetical protein
VFLFFVIALTAACRKEQSPLTSSPVKPAAPAVVSPKPVPPEPPLPAYRSIPIEGMKSIIQLTSELGKEGFTLVLKINRVDLDHVRQGEALIVPGKVGDLLTHASFPAEVEVLRPIPKAILVSRRIQAFGAYESGRLIFWGPTSTGKKATPTPAGLFHTNWKSKERVSTVDEHWLLRWYVNLANFAGVSFHQYALPGYPASHSCIRLLEEDAKWIYDWAEQWVLSKDGRQILAQGTPVVIFGDYTYDQPAPWKRLIEDPQAATVSVGEVDAALRDHLPLILERAKARATLLAALTSKQSN